ncbi:MAG: ribonuclease PH [Candidatus Edwardsbacteria bacterium]
MYFRADRRSPNQLRKVTIAPHYLETAEGSVLIEMGRTKVICTATIEEKLPPFLRNSGQGWITAEYGMLPRSSPERIPRESLAGRIGGRTQEIQRLIGRSLRAAVDLSLLGERTILIDCDVIRADGGTRTASITGSFIALYQAISFLKQKKIITQKPIKELVAGVSVGIIENTPLLDLSYEEDVKAEVDMNIVMTSSGKLVEIQGTAEGEPFTFSALDKMMALAKEGIKNLIEIQKDTLGIR